MDFIYYIFKDFVHYLAVLSVVAVILIAAIGIIKPALISKRVRLFSQRKYTAAGALASIIVLFGVVTLTAPINIEQESLDKKPAPTESIRNSPKRQAVKTAEQEKVEKKLIKQSRPIKFKTIQKTDKKLAPSQKKLAQKGKNGKMVSTYEVAYKNGEEIRRELKNQSVAWQPVPRIMLVSSSDFKRKKPKPSHELKKYCQSLFGSSMSSPTRVKKCSVFNN